MKTLKSSVLLFFFSLTVFAQSEADKMAYQAYITNNKSLWKQLVSEQEDTYKKAKTNENLYHLLLAQHGLLGATMADQDEDLFDDHYKKAKDNIKELIAADYQVANAKAVLSAVYGWEMAYSGYKGMFLGGKSSTNIQDATKLDPSSPLVWQVYASSKLFTPAMFGGDIKIALSSFEKAVELYEGNNAQRESNWRYLDALAWLGQAYEANNQKEMAKKVYGKALEIEPNFGWVKYALLPSVAR